MKIELQPITVREVADGYVDSAEEGVVGYGGKLNIRPNTSANSSTTPKSATPSSTPSARRSRSTSCTGSTTATERAYEVLDGQQRTISFCQYVMGDFDRIDGTRWPSTT